MLGVEVAEAPGEEVGLGAAPPVEEEALGAAVGAATADSD